MKLNKYLPFAFIYFFVNAVGLPFGLMWTALLGPFFYIWIVSDRKQEILWPFFLVLVPFIFMHTVFVGVDMGVYLVSLLNMTLVYIFCQAFYTFLKRCQEPETIFRNILIVNFFFCLAGMVLFFTPWDGLVWLKQHLTTGIPEYRRFKLFTYEPSIYATLFIPILFFYLLQYFLRQNRIPKVYLFVLITLPLILSFSIGVLGIALLSIFLTLLFRTDLLRKRRVVNVVVNSTVFLLGTIFILVLFFRNNTLFVRIKNIFGGADSSTKGRAEDSYILAQQMLEKKNEWWGIGFGQVKLLGHDIVQEYYRYIHEFTATIPSATAETLALMGWYGLVLRFVIEISLFFYTRVWANYYRLMLFIFMFFYQFVGSYFTNLAEYVIWILAFTNAFPQFDAKKTYQLQPSTKPV